jgi:hypothetical protein
MVDKRKNPVKLDGGSVKRLTRRKEKLPAATRKVRLLYPISPLNVKQREEFAQTLEKMGLRGLLDLCCDFDD